MRKSESRCPVTRMATMYQRTYAKKRGIKKASNYGMQVDSSIIFITRGKLCQNAGAARQWLGDDEKKKKKRNWNYYVRDRRINSRVSRNIDSSFSMSKRISFPRDSSPSQIVYNSWYFKSELLSFIRFVFRSIQIYSYFLLRINIKVFTVLPISIIAGRY